MSSEKKGKAARPRPDRGRGSEREELASLYRQVFDKCMAGEAKAFDAKGALSALEGLEKAKGLSAPDGGANRVILTLSDEVGSRGD